MHRILRLSFAAAALLFVAAVPASAQSAPEERSDYLRSRIRLQNAIEMQKHYEAERDKAGEKLNDLFRRDNEWMDRMMYERELGPLSDREKAADAEHWRQSRAEFYQIQQDWAENKIAAFEQKQAVDRVREELNRRIATYVAAIASQAMVASWETEPRPTRRSSTGTRQPPRRQAAPPRRPQADWWSDTARRLKENIPLATGGTRIR